MTEGFVRPEAKVLPGESLIPAGSLIRPPPNRFTHETMARIPFSYSTTGDGDATDGSLAAGTKVVLLRSDEHGRASVVDGSGLYVVVPVSGLRRLDDSGT